MKKTVILLASSALLTLSSLCAFASQVHQMGDTITVNNTLSQSIGYRMGDPGSLNQVYGIDGKGQDTYRIKEGDTGSEKIYAGPCKTHSIIPGFNTCDDPNAASEVHACNGGTHYDVLNVLSVTVNSIAGNSPSCTITCEAGHSGPTCA